MVRSRRREDHMVEKGEKGLVAAKTIDANKDIDNDKKKHISHSARASI